MRRSHQHARFRAAFEQEYMPSMRERYLNIKEQYINAKTRVETKLSEWRELYKRYPAPSIFTISAILWAVDIALNIPRMLFTAVSWLWEEFRATINTLFGYLIGNRYKKENVTEALGAHLAKDISNPTIIFNRFNHDSMPLPPDVALSLMDDLQDFYTAWWDALKSVPENKALAVLSFIFVKPFQFLLGLTYAAWSVASHAVSFAISCVNEAVSWIYTGIKAAVLVTLNAPLLIEDAYKDYKRNAAEKSHLENDAFHHQHVHLGDTTPWVTQALSQPTFEGMLQAVQQHLPTHDSSRPFADYRRPVIGSGFDGGDDADHYRTPVNRPGY